MNFILITDINNIIAKSDIQIIYKLMLFLENISYMGGDK